MYDRWVEELDDGKMVGGMMVDLGAAFDMVDHSPSFQNKTVLNWECQAR